MATSGLLPTFPTIILSPIISLVQGFLALPMEH